MADFLIETERYIKEKSVMNNNVDMKIITSKIILVQDTYIHLILGTPLFNEIKAQIIAGSVTALNQTLLDDYILKIMLHYVEMESIPYMKYKLTNKGIQVQSSDYSQSADLTDIQWLMDKSKNTAEMYAERCTKYLKQEIANYPLYLTYQNYSDIRPNKTNYTCSLFLDPSLGKSDYEEYMQRIGNYD